MRYGDLTRGILEHLVEAGAILLGGFFVPHPKTRLARALLGLDGRHSRTPAAVRHSFASTLYYLKKQGLVAKRGHHTKSRWAITKKGHAFLTRGRHNTVRIAPLEYPGLPATDNIVRLVSFDIPEKQRHKRDWLRAELLNCGYVVLHRSVFIGKRPLPEECIHAMDTLGLARYVQIVSIDRKGTLTQKV